MSSISTSTTPKTENPQQQTSTSNTTTTTKQSLRQKSSGQEFCEDVMKAEVSAKETAQAIRSRFASQRACDLIFRTEDANTICTQLEKVPVSVLNTPGTKNHCSLHVAAESGKLLVLKFLLQHGCNSCVLDEQGESPLFSALRSNNVLECVEALLLSLLQDTTKRDKLLSIQSNKDGGTVLHRACFKDNPLLVDLLLENGADVNIKNNRKASSLQLSKKISSKSIQEKLNRVAMQTTT